MNKGLTQFIELVNIQTSFAKNVIKKAKPDNFTSMDRDRNSNSFVRKSPLHNMVASFNAFTNKTVFFKSAHKLFSCNAGKAGHQTVTSIDSRMGLRYSLKACLMPIVLMYPATASLRFIIASSGSSPCDIMSNSGQYTVYPPFDGSEINSAEICNRCIALPPFKSISQYEGAVKAPKIFERKSPSCVSTMVYSVLRTAYSVLRKRNARDAERTTHDEKESVNGKQY